MIRYFCLHKSKNISFARRSPTVTGIPLAILATVFCNCRQQTSTLNERSKVQSTSENASAVSSPKIPSPYVVPSRSPLPAVPIELLLKANDQEGTVIVHSGSKVVLSWDSKGAAFCVGPQGPVGPSGTYETPPLDVETSFTIKCSGASGTAVSTVHIALDSDDASTPEPTSTSSPDPSPSPTPSPKSNIIR